MPGTDKKISQLPVSPTLDGTELVPIVNGGITVQTTTQEIADLNASAPQVNSDWNATSGVAEILNKPTIGVGDMTKAVYDVDNTGVVDNAEAIKIIGRNSTGSTLYKGTVVYISGSTGNRPNFVKAQANSEATSAGTFGIISDDLLNNTDGYALCLGYLDNLDTRSTAAHPFTTDTLADGDTIYLSPTDAGYITNVKPSAPNHLVYVGKVTRTSPTNGTIVYRIQNGYEVEELHNMQDVSYSTPIDADSLLIKDNTTSLWKRLTFSNLKTYLTGLYVSLTGDQTVAGKKTFTDLTIIGNASATGQRQLRIGQGTGWIDIGNASDGTGSGYIFFNQPTLTSANCGLSGSQYATILNSSNQVFIRLGNGNQIAINITNHVHTPTAASSGSITPFTFTIPANTNQTLSTNTPNFKVTGANKQFATGALASQYFNYFSANTLSFVGASTATEVFNSYFEKTLLGTNATITKNYAAGFGGDIKVAGNVNTYIDGGYNLYNAAGNQFIGSILRGSDASLLIEAAYANLKLGAGGFAGDILIYTSNAAKSIRLSSTIGTYIGSNLTTTPTAKLHLGAGTSTAGTAPLKLTSGTNLTTPEDGTFEYNGTNLYYTVGTARQKLTSSVTGITSNATPTINTDNCNAVTITALAADITSFTTNLTGTPNDFDKLTIRIKDNGTARLITWGSKFVAMGVDLPTTTVAGKILTVGFIYDTVLATWGCVSVAQQA